MSAEDLKISRRKRRNYHSGVMALSLVKDGIQKFIKETIHQQHQDLLKKLASHQSNMTTSCNSCTAQNLLPSHASRPKRPCIQKNSRHCFCKDNYFNRRHCPKNLCGRFYDEIVEAHSTNSPLWLNSNPSRWFEEEWELAKCFFASQGYTDVHSVEDTDMTGLISIAINNTFIQNKMNTKLEDVIEIREIRNCIFHSASHELEDQQVKSFIGKMIAFLENETALREFEDAKQAITKLKQLADECQCLTTMAEHLDLKEEAAKNVTNYISQQNVVLQQLHPLGKHGVSHEPFESSEATLSDYFSSETSFQDSPLKLQELPKCIQEKLIAYYKRSYSSTDVVPSLSEQQVHIDKMYVSPLLLLKPPPEEANKYFYEHSYYNTIQSKQATVKYKKISFDEFLYKENMFNKTILISGEAGVGKTSLCLKFLSEWCDFVTTTPTNSEELTPTSLTNKDYVFYIPLKHCQDCVSIEEMIRRRLVDEMYHTTLMNILQSDSERCLVILDGLDCWSPPKLACLDELNQGLPNRELVSQLTVIYTTRPWKMATVRPKSNNFDICMELRGIDDSAAEAGVDRVLDNLKWVCSRKSSKSSKDFIRFLEKRNLSNLATNPLLLKSVVALWFDGKVGDMSNSGIYTFIVDTFLDSIKHSVEHPVRSLYFIKLQKRFASNSNFCRFMETYILPLAKFSFHLCCKNNRRFCFIYQDYNLENFGLDNKTLKTLLKCGILCERAVYTQAATRKCTELSFIDDTFIDYFSAVYLSLFPEMFSNLFLTYEMLLDKKLVIQFLSGIGNVRVSTISERISFLVNSYKEVMKYRDGTLMFPGFIIEIQQLIFDCVQENENISSLLIGDLFLAASVVPSLDFLCHINVSGVRSLYIDCFIPKEIFQNILAHVWRLELLVIRKRERNSVDPLMLETYLENNKCSLKYLLLCGINLTEMTFHRKFKSLRRIKIENSRLTIKQGTDLIMCSSCLEEIVFENVIFINIPNKAQASHQSNVGETSVISNLEEGVTLDNTGVSVSSRMETLTITRCSFQDDDLITFLNTVSKAIPSMRVCLSFIYVKVVDNSNTEQVLKKLKKIYDYINTQDVRFFENQDKHK